MQALPSFLQSLFLYALTSNTSMALQNDRKSSVSHDTPTSDTQNVLPDMTRYFNFLLELTQSPERDGPRRQNLRRLKFGSWVKWKTASSKSKSRHGGRPYFPRAPRARLDRMPLAFGKRAESERWEQENGDEFDREARDRISRMPLTFGKRFPNKMHQDAAISRSEAADPKDVAFPEVFSLDQIYSAGNKSPSLKRRSNRLTRMPITFGKRTRTPMENYLLGNPDRQYRYSAGNDKLQEESFTREGRPSLSRMPLTFGRKKKTTGEFAASGGQNANQENSPASHKNMRDSLLINLAEKLASTAANRPSASSVTDVKSPSQNVNKEILENDVILSGTLPERKLGIHENDDVPRDPTGQNIPDVIYPYDAFPVERRTVINRMPLTFGKRERPAPNVQLADLYGYGQQGPDADRKAEDQDKGWLYAGQGEEDESDTGRGRNRSHDNGGHMIPEGEYDWADAL